MPTSRHHGRKRQHFKPTSFHFSDSLPLSAPLAERTAKAHLARRRRAAHKFAPATRAEVYVFFIHAATIPCSQTLYQIRGRCAASRSMMYVMAVKNPAVFVVHENHPAVVPVDAAVGKIVFRLRTVGRNDEMHHVRMWILVSRVHICIVHSIARKHITLRLRERAGRRPL